MQATTILSVRVRGTAAIGGDGQVSLQNGILKHEARKIHRLLDGRVVVGFAGATADALALMERFEAKLKDHQGSLLRSAIELAKDWRTDRTLRRLESLMIAMDKDATFLVSGSGDVIAPDDGIMGIGSGGLYAVAAARALARNTQLTARQIVEESLKITAGICVFTNDHLIIEEL